MNNQACDSGNTVRRPCASESAEPQSFIETEYSHVREKLLQKRIAMDINKEASKYTPRSFDRRDFYYPSLHPQQTGSLAMDHAFDAVSRGDTDFVRTLLFAALPVNCKNSKGDTLLHIAVQQRNTLLCLELLAFGAEPRIPNKKNQTPLDLAKECRVDVPYLEHVLQHGLENKACMFSGLW